jgi:predicted peptidase
MLARSTKGIFLIPFLLFAACGSKHSFSEDEFLTRSVKVGNQTYSYRVYLPPNRIPNQKTPVMLYLHGSNRRGTDNESQVQDLADAIKWYPENFPFIIVFPQCRQDTFWAGPMIDQAIAALDQTAKEFNGDKRRLYLAGYSMGGFGTWQTALTYPNKFAALVPVAGGIEPIGTISDEDRMLLSPQVTAAVATPDPYKAYAQSLAKTPVWVVHGANDEAVPVDAARKIVAALKAAGDPDVNYVELEGVGHGSVGIAFGDKKLSEWLAKQELSQ